MCSAPNSNCESMKCAISSSLQYWRWAAIADKYDASNNPSYAVRLGDEGETCITKSTRPVELIAFNLSASCRAVRRPVVVCVKTE